LRKTQSTTEQNFVITAVEQLLKHFS